MLHLSALEYFFMADSHFWVLKKLFPMFFTSSATAWTFSALFERKLSLSIATTNIKRLQSKCLQTDQLKFQTLGKILNPITIFTQWFRKFTSIFHRGLWTGFWQTQREETARTSLKSTSESSGKSGWASPEPSFGATPQPSPSLCSPQSPITHGCGRIRHGNS